MATNVIKTDIGQPIIFRTSNEEVYNSTLSEGSIWMRTSQFYREIEDEARRDAGEGVNGTQTLFPIHLESKGGPNLSLQGPGIVGQEIINHYIVSMHGTSITPEIRNEFGGFTLGVKSIFNLALELAVKAGEQLKVTGYRYGKVSYTHTALSITHGSGGSAIALGGNPPISLRSIDTDVLRKQ